MNIKNNKTIFLNIILGIAFIIGGCVYAWYKSDVLLTFNSAEKAYNDGHYFTSAVKDDAESIYAAAVYGIYDTGYGTSDGKSEVYVISGDDGAYFLEANPNDSNFKSLVELYDSYYNEEHSEDEYAPVKYLFVEPEPNVDKYGTLQEIADEIDSDHSHRDSEDFKLYDDFYLSSVSLTKTIVFDLAVTLIVIAIGIGIIISAILRKSKNKDTYERLCELDERLEGDVNELENVADYVDKSIGTYVYRDHLILNTKFGLDMFDLNKLVWIYYNIVKHKAYIVFTVSVDFALQINLYEDGRIRERRVMLTNNKKAQDAIKSLLTYIGMNYPNSIIGFTPEAKQAYKEFKLSHG